MSVSVGDDSYHSVHSLALLCSDLLKLEQHLQLQLQLHQVSTSQYLETRISRSPWAARSIVIIVPARFRPEPEWPLESQVESQTEVAG